MAIVSEKEPPLPAEYDTGTDNLAKLLRGTESLVHSLVLSRNAIYKSVISNMETMRNSEVISDQFNVDCMEYLRISYLRKSKINQEL